MNATNWRLSISRPTAWAASDLSLLLRSSSAPGRILQPAAINCFSSPALETAVVVNTWPYSLAGERCIPLGRSRNLAFPFRSHHPKIVNHLLRHPGRFACTNWSGHCWYPARTVHSERRPVAVARRATTQSSSRFLQYGSAIAILRRPQPLIADSNRWMQAYMPTAAVPCRPAAGTLLSERLHDRLGVNICCG